jgi:hypothetical protein
MCWRLVHVCMCVRVRVQDYLYTVLSRSSKTNEARVVGSIVDFVFAPDDHQACIDRLVSTCRRCVAATAAAAPPPLPPPPLLLPPLPLRCRCCCAAAAASPPLRLPRRACLCRGRCACAAVAARVWA